MRTILITISISALLGGGGVYVWSYHGGFVPERASAVHFIEVFGDYSEIADEVERLVHIPGNKGNDERAKLLGLLESILTQDMDMERRGQMARLALSNLHTIKEEIHVAQASQARLYTSLQDLDAASRTFKSRDLRDRAEEIVAIARRRAEASAHIMSVLAKTNEQTQAILERIAEEGGDLSYEHVVEINDATLVAEERFEVLRGLYEELLSEREVLQTRFHEFVAVSI
jgi:hypothetical protein